jgi:alkanesulfonate monooxygenase SsuD/methylene tetrahydromethanopterin reductase-like flavin-dependent oxidoreductase (luciferase family)
MVLRAVPTGIVLAPNPQAINRVDDVVAQASRACDLGVRQVSLSQQNDHDAIALAALVGAAVPGLGVGTAVVPINPRHPLIVASLAQTAQAASRGNFSLGLGLGAHEPERLAFGMSWPNTITRLREHLTVLRSIFDTGAPRPTAGRVHACPRRGMRVSAPPDGRVYRFAAVLRRGWVVRAATRTALGRARVLVRLSMWASAMSSAVAIGATS